MGSESTNMVGYTIVSLVLIITVSLVVAQKISYINSVDSYTMVYSASDMALMIDAIYAAPNNVVFNYKIGTGNFTYDISDGVITTRKIGSGHYGKRAFHRYGFSKKTALNEGTFSFANSTVFFSLQKSNNKIIISNLSKEGKSSVATPVKKSCPIADTSFEGDGTHVLLDFPIIENLNDPNKNAVSKAKNLLDSILLNKQYGISRSTKTTTDNFGDVVEQSKGKKLYLYVQKDDNISGLQVMTKEHNSKSSKLLCLIENELSANHNIEVKYGFYGDYSKFNDIESDVVLVVIYGEEYGVSISNAVFSKSIISFIEDYFK